MSEKGSFIFKVEPRRGKKKANCKSGVSYLVSSTKSKVAEGTRVAKHPAYLGLASSPLTPS